MAGLRLADLTQTTDGAAHSGRSGGAHAPRATGNLLVASAAFPDTNNATLDGVLAAERAGVAAVLRNLNLLDLATERRAVAGAVLARDSDLDRTLGLRLACSCERCVLQHTMTCYASRGGETAESGDAKEYGQSRVDIFLHVIYARPAAHGAPSHASPRSTRTWSCAWHHARRASARSAHSEHCTAVQGK